MFQESLVESTSLLRGRSRWPAVISFALQATIATTLVVLPLVHPEILPLSSPRISLTAPRLRPAVVPEQRVRVETSSMQNAVSVPTQVARISTQGFRSSGAEVDEPSLAVGGVDLTGPGGGPISLLGPGGPAGPHVVVGAGAGPMHVSTGVMAGQLLEPIRPEYPVTARLSRAEGTVVVQAVISKSGRIESARVVSGPPVLQTAALQAVRAARYRPFLLNGLPTEVETTVSITFRLGD
ncbi:energy transducer TonB [Granulicella sp. L46]|uniref:energy transducer TonB n=1 Tax=Granulicella sp. L46 TaxID=1641865 RepID=UPI00131DB674|nr:energy transducer TonB [Granulicella sp. L46]